MRAGLLSIVLVVAVGQGVNAQPARRLDPPAGLSGEGAASFSVHLWVRVARRDDRFTAVAASKRWNDGEIEDHTSHHDLGRRRSTGARAGWVIATQPDGSWCWNAGDGERRQDYLPTAARQPLADGAWHLLAFAVDAVSDTAALYHDGRQVALLDLGGLGPLPAAAPVWLASDAAGGLVLDGDVEDAAVVPGVLSAAEVAELFRRRAGAPPPPPPRAGDAVTVMAWNIWHGGRRDGEADGLRRVVEVIRSSGADVVAMQETYGSGPRIADALGWHLYLRSSNIAVLSRFPFVATHAIFAPFHCGGVTLDLGEERRLAVFSLWIRHLPDHAEAARAGATADELVAAEAPTRRREIEGILADLAPHLATASRVPVVVAGDFNSPSHLDWTPARQEANFGLAVRWPVSLAMARAGFADAFRRAHPDPASAPGRTWSPRFTEARQDRIDRVYVRGPGLSVRAASMLDRHPERWPSDHAAVLATLALEPSHERRAVEGFDVRVDRELLRGDPELAAATLRELEHQLYEVGRAVPLPALARLREVPVWVNARSSTRCMAYHPSAEWLLEHGFDEAMARAVEIGDPRTFLSWTRLQPSMVLHELAHAYHHRVLGFDHAGIRAAFERAQESPAYQRVLHADGREVRPYALTDHKEFFAELSEALFGTNDMYPFVRGELRRHDPEAHELLLRLWGEQ